MKSPSEEINIQHPGSLEDLKRAAARAQLRSARRTMWVVATVATLAAALMSIWSWALKIEAEKTRDQAVLVEELALQKKKAVGIRAVSPDRTAFVSKAGYLVDAKSNNPVAQLTTQNINVVQFSPDGSRIVLGGGRQISIFDRSGAKLNEFSAFDDVATITFAPDGKEIAVVSTTGSVELRSLDGDSLREFRTSEPIRVAAFSSDNRLLITALETGELETWDLATGRLIGHLRGLDPTPPTLIGVGTDSRHGLAAYRNGRIMVWDFATQEVSTFLAFTP
jgi:WD40 repeat protein